MIWLQRFLSIAVTQYKAKVLVSHLILLTNETLMETFKRRRVILDIKVVYPDEHEGFELVSGTLFAEIMFEADWVMK